MKDGQRSFLQNIEALFDGGVIGEQTDRQLLQLFAVRDPVAAELAFTVLVRRHGPMVFRACRAILRDPHAAEDAFQATFLVLARKAGGGPAPGRGGGRSGEGAAGRRDQIEIRRPAANYLISDAGRPAMKATPPSSPAKTPTAVNTRAVMERKTDIRKI